MHSEGTFWALHCALLGKLTGFAALLVSSYVLMLDYVNEVPFLWHTVFDGLNDTSRGIMLSTNYYVLTVHWK